MAQLSSMSCSAEGRLDKAVTSERARVVKSVMFRYKSTRQTRELLENFRMMVNHAIDITIKENIQGRYSLRNRIYEEFKERYGVVSCYPYPVAEVAWSIVKKHRKWQRTPFAKRLMLTMDSQNYSLHYGIISLPFRKGQRLLVPLQYGNWQRSFLMDETLKRGSVTVTEDSIFITFSREAPGIEPAKRIGYDLNHTSIIGSDGGKFDLSEVARLHTEYGVRRSRFSERHPNDRRLKQKFSGSTRERERVKQALDVVSKQIVDKATKNREALVLERLNGMRKAHRRSSRESEGPRRRANLWPFRQLQQQIAHKAAWAGVPVEFVNPSRTSQICHICGTTNRKLRLTEREWRCPFCGATLDRDLNAAVNIERRGKIPCLGEVRPGAQGTNEAMKGNEQTASLILRAEALK